MNEKLWLILAVLLGAVALVLLAPARPEPPVEVATADEELVAAGRFVLDHDGARWLDETYSLLRAEDGNYLLVSKATLTLSGQKIALADQTLYTTEYRPLSYQMAAETAAGAQVISAQEAGGEFTMEVRVGTARQSVEGTWDESLFLLDNNLIAHYAILFRAIEEGLVAQTFSAAVPQALARIPGRWDEPTAIRFRSGDATYEGEATTVRVGDTVIDLVSYGGRLVGLVGRTQGTVAYDPSLLPDGLSVETAVIERPTSQAREREISFQSEDVRLVGTLTLPPPQTPARCALLFVAGSGPVDRDGNAAGLKMDAYRQLAASLAEAGVVSLRYDKRGVGESSGDAATASRSDLLADVRAAWKALKAAPEASGLPCFALGHSEGTYLVEDLAGGDAGVAGLVLLCGTPRSLADVTRWQVETLLRQQGATDAQVAVALEQEDEYIAFVKSSRGQWSDYTSDDLLREMPWLGAAGAEQMRASALGLAWLREHYNADPASVLARVACPVLVLSAEKDVQVPPGDGQAVADVLAASGNEEVEVVFLSDLNHLLRHQPEEPNIAYRHLDEPVDPRVAEAIARWIWERDGA